MTHLFTYLIVLMFIAGFAARADEHEHEAEHAHSHGPHVHGAGQLNVVLAGDVLAIEVELPGVHVTGNESHPPKSEAEKLAADSVLGKEGAAQWLKPTPAAKCSLTKAARKFDSETGAKHGNHFEFHGQYHFKCTEPKSLKGLEVAFFTHIEKLKSDGILDKKKVEPLDHFDTVKVNDRGQIPGKLSPKQNTLALP